MIPKATRVLLTLGLLLGLVAAGIGSESVQASAVAESRLYFPWMPSGAVLSHSEAFSDSGPYYGSITVQNLENEQIVLYYQATNGESFGVIGDFQSTLVAAYGARTFTPQQFQLDETVEGTGVVFIARKFSDTSLPARISGVQKQAAAKPIDVDAKTDGGHLTVGGYTGLRSLSNGPVVRLPIVQTNSNWNTVIRATNFEPYEATAKINLTLREAGGGSELSFDETVNSGGTATFDLLALGVPLDWIGSAVISSDEIVSVVAERFKNETGMLIMNSGQRAANAASVSYLPLVLRDWFGWNTGISLLNPHEVPVNATVSFYAMDGELVDSEVVTLPASGMDFVYMPAGDGAPFVGSGVVSSEGHLLGAIDEVKYTGDPAEGAGHAMSYMMQPDLAYPGQQLSMPLYQKGNPETGGGNTSGVQLFNPTNTTVTYGYSFFDQFGNMMPIPAGPAPTLGPGENTTIYAMELAQLPDGFNGSMIVGVHSGGALTGISNNVNYDVQLDGSASFNMTVLGVPDDPDPPDPPNGFITP
ncbi:MAG: hypothetical protein EA415_01075 [Sphaerobacteraceae bacterium]|nr:MAG: hypothetical protein EA415_01075 [Sphaerobacteraceae bacterium]